MNYLKELNLFYQRLENENLPSNAILLWHTLMSIGNSLYWKDELPITLSQIENRSHLSKPTIWRMRKLLEEKGYISYRPTGGRTCGIYRLRSLESLCEIIPIQDKVSDRPHDLAFQLALPCEMQSKNESELSFQSESITEMQNDLAFHTEHIHKPLLKHKTSSKEKDKKEILEGEEKASTTHDKGKQSLPSISKQKRKSSAAHGTLDQWLHELEEPWQGIMRTWMSYKKERQESYKGQVSAKTCLKRLKEFSKSDAAIAQQIVDQSIANNWAGFFALKQQDFSNTSTSRPAYGQPIGQILQPRTEERKRELLAIFENDN